MSVSLPPRLAKNAASALFTAHCAATLASLGLRRDRAATVLRRAIASASGLDVLRRPDERDWLRRIEALRRRLNASDAPVEVVDHGAGSSMSAAGAPAPVTTRRLGEISYGASKSPAQARFLFRLVRELGPVVALELGTCVGISTAYQAAALELNGAGRLHTMEGSPALAERARSHLDQLGLATVEVHVGQFDTLLDPWLDREPELSFAFVDGHHDETATVDYWRRLAPHLSRRSAVVFDDIRWSAGMRRAWRTIAGDPTAHTTADLGTMGVCLVGDW